MRLALILFAALTVVVSPALAIDVPPWVSAAASLSVPKYDEEVGGVCLLDETVVTVTPSGNIRSTHRQAFRILATEGRYLATAAVAFDRETKVDGLRGWSIPASGEPFAVKERDAVEISNTDFELYSDSKVISLQLPGADPGSVVAWEYQQVHRPFATHDLWHFQRSIPVLRARYTVTVPAGWKHEARWTNAAPVAPTFEGSAISWEVTNVPEIRSEPGRPPFRAVAGRLGIKFFPPEDDGSRSHATWNDVSRWYATLVAPRLKPDDSMKLKTQQLTAGKDGVLEKIRALGSFAQKEIRYVAIEIGIGGYQPHKAADVFRSRHGDCKDKVTLLSAMLSEAGIESYYLLVNTDRGSVDPKFASVTNFDHVISAIRLPDSFKDDSLQSVVRHPTLGRLLLFDPTDTFVPVGLIPHYLQDSDALLVAPSGDLIHIPPQAAEASHVHIEAKAKLATNGALTAEIRERRSGWIAASYRSSLAARSQAERTQMIEERLAWHFSSFAVSDIRFENLEDNDSELIVSYKISAPGFARVSPSMVLVRPRLLGRKAEMLLDLKKRQYGYELDAPSQQTDEFEIEVPDTLAIDELPTGQKLERPQLRYSSSYTAEGNKLRYKREYRVEEMDVPLQELKELNAVFSRILADERSNAVLLPK